MKIIKDKFGYIILGIFLVKLFLLTWSAHPFDFWAFVNTIQRNTLYGWNVFESWNKGNIIILLWYPLYSLYLVMLQITHSVIDNILLLHLFFKLPFLLVDLVSAFYIYKIILCYTNNQSIAKKSFMIWFTNPIVFYTYGIHGHYEILVALSIILIIYGLINKSVIYLCIGLILGIETKYFFIIFLPFIIIYFLSQKRIKDLFFLVFLTCMGLLLSFIHVFFNPILFTQIINSINNLSKINNQQVFQVLKMPATNIFSSINYLFKPLMPINNIDNELLFKVASNGLMIVALILLVHIIFRVVRIFIYSINYSNTIIIKDIFISLCYLLVFLSSFQLHYMIWLIPFLIFYCVIDNNNILIYLFVLLTVVGTILSFRGELGTYTFFLDLLNNQSIELFSLSSRYLAIVYREGMLIIFTIILSAMYIIYDGMQKKYHIINKTTGYNVYVIYLGISIILWVIIIIPYIQIFRLYIHQKNHQTELAYSRISNINRGFISATYKFSHINDNKIYFDDHNSTIFYGVKKLDPFNKNNFSINIILPLDNGYSIKREVFFNECPVNYHKNDETEMLEIYSSIDCLKSENNYISNIYDYPQLDRLKITVKNHEVDYVYSPSMKYVVILMSLLGILYIIMSIYIIYSIVMSVSSSKNKIN